jgi:hypothetical protein
MFFDDLAELGRSCALVVGMMFRSDAGDGAGCLEPGARTALIRLSSIGGVNRSNADARSVHRWATLGLDTRVSVELSDSRVL